MYRLILLFNIISSQAFAEVKFDFPIDSSQFSQTQDFGPSAYIKDKKPQFNLKCHIYPEFVLLTLYDPGMKGTGYQFLPRNNKKSKSDLCSIGTMPKDFPFWGGPMEGVMGSVIAFSSEESLGNLDILTFFDAKKKKTIFSVQFNNGAPLLIKKKNEKIGLTYDAYLEYPKQRCNPVVDPDGSCLKAILKANGIANSKDLAKVDCSEALRQDPTVAKSGSVHLFVEAQVDDIRNPKKSFVGKKITCHFSP